MKHRSVLCILAFFTACGGAGAPDRPADKAAGKTADRPAAEASEELKDRSGTALATVKETIDGVSFAIDLPPGMKREEKATEKWINWTFTDGNPFMEPSITVKRADPAMAPKDLAALVRSASLPTQDKPPLVVAKQEELPDGAGQLVVTERADNQFFKVETLIRKGDTILRCTVLQRTGTGRPQDRPVPNAAATKAWAEKICSSITID